MLTVSAPLNTFAAASPAHRPTHTHLYMCDYTSTGGFTQSYIYNEKNQSSNSGILTSIAWKNYMYNVHFGN